MKKKQLIAIVEGGIMIALAYLLSILKVWEMPQGGSITLACLPLIVYAYRRGFLNGLTASTAFAVLHFALDPYRSFHPVSILFDYLLACAVLSLMGVKANENTIINSVKIIFIYLVKYIFAVLSGVIVFYSYAPGFASGESATLGEALKNTGVWLYSAGYNSYLFAEMAVMVILFGILRKAVLTRFKVT